MLFLVALDEIDIYFVSSSSTFVRKPIGMAPNQRAAKSIEALRNFLLPTEYLSMKLIEYVPHDVKFSIRAYPS